MSFKEGERHDLPLTLGKLFNISKPTLFYFFSIAFVVTDLLNFCMDFRISMSLL